MEAPPVDPRTSALPGDTSVGDVTEPDQESLSGLIPAVDGSAPDERALRERLLQGDEAAFEALVASHHGAMLRFARSFLSKPDVAEEVVQETWLAVLRGLATFEGRSSLKTWIFHILANRARSRATREGRVIPFAELKPPEDDGPEAGEELAFRADGRWSEPPQPWQAHTPEALILRREAVELLEHALEALPPNQRTVVTLRDVEGLTAPEVCNVLQISETNQRVLLHRGRTRLRLALDGVLGHRA
jgi:RNA polymerase sigma-70 factor (ECF subfamily)